MNFWTQTEIDTLKKEYITKSAQEIATILGKSESAIQNKAYKLGLRKPEMETNDSFFSSWNDTMAYLLGFFASDGNVFLDSGRPKFTFAQKAEKEYIEWIRDLLCPSHKVYYNPKKDTYRIQFTSQKMYNDLCAIFGMTVENKSLTLNFPNIPDKYMRMFLLGCIDGDGSFGIYSGRKPRGTLTSGSIDFANGFSETVKSLTGLTSLIQKNGSAYNVMYQGIKGVCLAWYLYHDYKFNLEHKSQRAFQVMNYRPKRIWQSSITPKMEQMFSHILDGIARMTYG